MKMLASFSKAEDAHLLRARLEGSGIAAYVRDEHMVTADWLYSNAIGGVKVDVADEDFDTALVFIEPQAAERSPAMSPPHSAWHFVTVLFAVAACTFIVVAVRNGVIAHPGKYAVPAGFGIGFGALAVVLSLLRNRARQ
jgi:hypothetical protein